MNYQHITRIITSNDTNIEHQKVPLNGRLSLQKGGGDFLMVEIPQEFLDQVYEAIQEDGMQKPDYRAHVSVMSGDEMNDIEVEEVGEDITLELGPIMSVNPEGWDEMDRVWFIECEAPRLKEIRQKYGLTPLVHGNHEFHITVAVKPKGEEMRFSSKEEAVQHLANVTGKKIIIATNEEEIKAKLIDFLIQNKNPDDDKFHKFAEELGVDVHELEAKAYGLATSFATFLNNGRAIEKGVTKDQVDPEELRMGIAVEKEHTPDANVATRIAIDHLAEIKNYYTLLKEMEKSAGVEE